jgi:hypothetical protein
MEQNNILGIFDDYESFIQALKDLKEMGIDNISTFTPVPFHEVDKVLGEKQSPIRFLTLTGGLIGFAVGAWLTVYCTQAYPLIVGGKPLISVPPYLIIAFELTILLSTMLTAIGYFLISPISRSKLGTSYDPSFSEDKFGISIDTTGTGSKPLKEVLEANGATEIRIQ